MRYRAFALALSASLASAAGARAQAVQADVTFPYAFRHDAAGVSMDVGGELPGPESLFLGGEWTYFEPTWTEYPPGGEIHLNQEIDTFDAVIRYAFPLFEPAGPRHGYGPGFFYPSIEGYLGAGAGVGIVRERQYHHLLGSPPFGYTLADLDGGEPTWEISAGLVFDLTPRLSLRAGYRYIGIPTVKLFGGKSNLDTSAIEGGLTFRF